MSKKTNLPKVRFSFTYRSPSLIRRIRQDLNGGAWCPKTMVGQDSSEWLEVDLGSVHAVTATETQGRFGNGQGAEFAEGYALEYWRPRLGKWARYRGREGSSDVLPGNANTYLAVKNDLDPAFLASRVRFHPHSAFKRTVCMRVELYGCEYHGGLSAYSMPQGDRRGTAYEFYDWRYDGEWRGSRLLNGLGCLVDGDYGPQNFKLSYYAQGEASSIRRVLVVAHMFPLPPTIQYPILHTTTSLCLGTCPPSLSFLLRHPDRLQPCSYVPSTVLQACAEMSSFLENFKNRLKC